MSEKKDVKIEAPTAHLGVRALPPQIRLFRKFVKYHWKFIVLAWIPTLISITLPLFIEAKILSVGLSIVLSLIAFFFGSFAITRHKQERIYG